MDSVDKAIKEANDLADRLIKESHIKLKMQGAKEWLMTDIVIKRAYFAVVYFALFGFIAYEIAIY